LTKEQLKEEQEKHLKEEEDREKNEGKNLIYYIYIKL